MISKKQLTEDVKSLLSNKERFEYLTNEEAAWLTENVLSHHPEWNWYKDRQPQRIYKDKADHGTSCFYIEFSNGEKSSISYLKCIKNIKK